MCVASETLARFLIVDDNPAIHQDIRKILTPRPQNSSLDELEQLMFGNSSANAASDTFEIQDAYQGQEAFELVKRACEQDTAFDVAIVDMRMPPGWDGLETIEKLWSVDPDLQIIICTAFSDYSWEQINQRLGLQDKLLILKKPFDDCELLQAARSLGVKRRLQYQARYNLDTLQLLVTKRTRELASLHQESARLLDSIAAGLVAYDVFGCVTRWNGVAEKLFGLSEQEAVSRPLLELPIAWQDAPSFQDFFRSNQCLENRRMEASLQDSAGQPLVVELSLHPVAIDGLPAGGLMLVDDVTARRLLEQQLNQAQKLESIGQLAAGIAHEINTPMQYVGDNVQFLHATLEKLEPPLHLLEELLAAEAVDSSAIVERIRQSMGKLNLRKLLEHLPNSIGDVEQGIENIVRIVQAMKELSHPGADTPAAMDINRILESAIVVSRSEWKHIATVEKDLDPNPPGLIGFANQLQQALLNLVVNATHAIDARRRNDENLVGKIRISTLTMKERFVISVQDNGCGIPDHIRNRVYDPFFTTKGVGKGTGQGLAIAYQVVVKNNQGRLWFESETGVGTTFYMELPIDPNAGVL